MGLAKTVCILSAHILSLFFGLVQVDPLMQSPIAIHQVFSKSILGATCRCPDPSGSLITHSSHFSRGVEAANRDKPVTMANHQSGLTEISHSRNATQNHERHRCHLHRSGFPVLGFQGLPSPKSSSEESDGFSGLARRTRLLEEGGTAEATPSLLGSSLFSTGALLQTF